MGLWQSLFGGGTGSSHRATIQPLGREIVVAGKQTILDAALQQGIAFPHNCRVGGCATCKCKLVSGKVREMTDKSYLLSADEMREGYILGCQSVPQTDVVVHVPHLSEERPSHAVSTYAGTVAAAALQTPDIVELRVDLEQPLTYTAGQYASLSMPGLPGIAQLRRDFSFAAAPGAEPGYDTATGATRTVHFHIRHARGGRFTDSLFAAVAHGDLAGQRVELEGPLGDFWLRPSPRKLLCIAGGTGMAPIKALLEDMRYKGLARDVLYYYGARTQSDLYAQDAMERLRRSWLATFDFVPVLSAEPEGSSWAGARGLVTEAVAALGDQVADCDVYMCGPPAMLDAATELVSARGVPRERIYADRFLDASTAPAPRP